MRIQKGNCSVCAEHGDNKEKWIVNRTHSLCAVHNQERLHPSGKRQTKRLRPHRYSQSFNYSTKWGFTSEMEMFRWIWENRPHISYFTGRPVTFHPACFLHVLPKALSKYPHFRLNPENIVLGTMEEHNLADNGTTAQRNAYKKRFVNYSFEEYKQLEAELIINYSNDDFQR